MTLIFGMMLDAILGEPRWLWSRLPHPAVLIGRLIGWCDVQFNVGDHRCRKGVLVLTALCVMAAGLGWLLRIIPGGLVEVFVLAILLAQKSLVDHVRAVADALRLSLADGRRAVAMIVGRDTQQMDAPAVARSAIESAAENLSDGVIAPIVWFAIAGLPGLFVYKVVNTADSMIGYRTPRHADFGWAAARFDDMLNLIPARLTALMIWLVTSRPAISAILHEAPLHRSPNAGWPEAAMAYGIGVALSGPRSYHGEMRPYPFVNLEGDHVLTADHIDQAINVLWQTWALTLVVVAIGVIVAL